MTNGFAAGIAHLADHPSFARRDLSSMRRGNLYPIMAPDARPADPELRHNMLGMTEAGSVVLISDDESDQPEERRGSFGRPAPGFETMIIDPDTGVAARRVGELCIRGPYVMQRYYKRSREECFDADGWFHTGDLVRVDDDGFIYFVGRLSAMIKTAGANVSAAEVEKAIAKVTGGWWLTLSAFQTPNADRWWPRSSSYRTALRPSTKRHCASGSRRELSAYKIPKRFVALPRAESTAAVQRQGRHAATEEAVRCLTTIDQLVRFRAAHDGAKPMVIDPASRVSYRELDTTTRDLAAAFVDAGVGKGTRVGLIMPNSVRWVQVAIALTRIGAVLVPLSTLLAAGELVAQLRTACGAIPGERRGIPWPPLPGRPASARPCRDTRSNFLPYARFGRSTGSPAPPPGSAPAGSSTP